MKKENNFLLWIVGLCAFVSFVAKGLIWMFGKFNWNVPGLSQALTIANLVLMIGTLVAGILWVMTFKNKKARTVFLVILIVFAAMSILGLYW